MKRNIIFFIAIILSFACHKDYNIFDDNDFEQKIVLHSFASPDSILRVFVSKTVVPEQLDTNIFIKNAVVELYEDGVFVENLEYFEKREILYDVEEDDYQQIALIKYYKSNSVLKLNHLYTLKVIVDGKEVSADFYFPEISFVSEIDVSGIQCDTIQEANSFFYYNIKGSFLVKLNITKNGHYMIRLMTNCWQVDYNKLPDGYFDIPDSAYYRTVSDVYFNDKSESSGIADLNYLYANYPFLTFTNNYNNTFIYTKLSDENYINLPLSLDFSEEKKDGESIYIKYQIFELSDEIYDYYSSLNKYWDADDNPFVEPVNVFSNIEGGFGLVAGYNVVEDSVKIDITSVK